MNTSSPVQPVTYSLILCSPCLPPAAPQDGGRAPQEDEGVSLVQPLGATGAEGPRMGQPVQWAGVQPAPPPRGQPSDNAVHWGAGSGGGNRLGAISAPCPPPPRAACVAAGREEEAVSLASTMSSSELADEVLSLPGWSLTMADVAAAGVVPRRATQRIASPFLSKLPTAQLAMSTIPHTSWSKVLESATLAGSSGQVDAAPYVLTPLASGEDVEALSPCHWLPRELVDVMELEARQ